jgi:hypothetical protein
MAGSESIRRIGRYLIPAYACIKSTGIHKVNIYEKTAGFEMVLAIIALSTVYVFGRKRR